MGRWAERMVEHPIHKTLSDTRTLCQIEDDDPDVAKYEKLRILKYVGACEGVLGEVDPELAPFNTLDAINKMLSGPDVANRISQFYTDHNVEHLVHANNNIANQIGNLALLLSLSEDHKPVRPIPELEALIRQHQKKLNDSSKSFSSTLDKFRESINGLEGQLSKLKSEMQGKINEVNSQITQWQQQFSEAQESRRNEFSEVKTRAEAAILEWSKQFNDSQNSRNNDFGKLTSEIKKDAEEKTAKLINESSNKLEKSYSEYESRIDAMLTDSGNKHGEILSLYQLAAEDSVAGGYLRNANEERNFADTWRVWTVIFIACTVAWLMSAILSDFTVSQTGAVIWHKVALSFALSGVLLFGAAYSAQQSTRHRNAEKRTRWFALEVKAIDPFIHSLPEEQKQALKKELSERMFGHFTKAEDEKGRIVDEHAAGVLVKLITDVMKSTPRPGK